MTLIATGTEREAGAQRALATAFAPQSIAIAGVSQRNTGWGGGQMFLSGIRKLGRVPNVYCLNPRGGELSDGTPLYQSLLDVPGPVDSVISAVPASAILGLVDDAVVKGVKVIHLFTAGFGETGSAERAELEQQVLAKLRAGGIRLIGPNCMGIHSTRGGCELDGRGIVHARARRDALAIGHERLRGRLGRRAPRRPVLQYGLLRQCIRPQ